ncbi:hypothetical protein VZT92_010173 [Zoarces viviparus]|uniref:Uncharacterized protein n=1 Tax=Zoarces viviparus TaxID=48416 RepID=A0AAW1FD77_ZOAVI
MLSRTVPWRSPSQSSPTHYSTLMAKNTGGEGARMFEPLAKWTDDTSFSGHTPHSSPLPVFTHSSSSPMKD